VAAREPAHLLQALDRNQGREGLPLALDDELVMAQRDPIEQIADPSPDVDRGYPFSHATMLVALLDPGKRPRKNPQRDNAWISAAAPPASPWENRTARHFERPGFPYGCNMSLDTSCSSLSHVSYGNVVVLMGGFLAS
jgi:hypothetical protein